MINEICVVVFIWKPIVSMPWNKALSVYSIATANNLNSPSANSSVETEKVLSIGYRAEIPFFFIFYQCIFIFVLKNEATEGWPSLSRPTLPEHAGYDYLMSPCLVECRYTLCPGS